MKPRDGLTELSKNELIIKINDLHKEMEVFLEYSFDGYWDWYIQEDYEYMSPHFWSMFGYDYRDKEHKPSEWQDIIHPEDLEIALENFNKHCDSRGKYPYEQEVRYMHKNGEYVTVFCRGQVVKWNEKGEPLRMIGTHSDLTKEHKFNELEKFKDIFLNREERIIELKNEINEVLKKDGQPIRYKLTGKVK
jgi:PAS domain S-box-containing protein